jgi:hypothetical protein
MECLECSSESSTHSSEFCPSSSRHHCPGVSRMARRRGRRRNRCSQSLGPHGPGAARAQTARAPREHTERFSKRTRALSQVDCRQVHAYARLRPGAIAHTRARANAQFGQDGCRGRIQAREVRRLAESASARRCAAAAAGIAAKADSAPALAAAAPGGPHSSAPAAFAAALGRGSSIADRREAGAVVDSARAAPRGEGERKHRAECRSRHQDERAIFLVVESPRAAPPLPAAAAPPPASPAVLSRQRSRLSPAEAWAGPGAQVGRGAAMRPAQGLHAAGGSHAGDGAAATAARAGPGPPSVKPHRWLDAAEADRTDAPVQRHWLPPAPQPWRERISGAARESSAGRQRRSRSSPQPPPTLRDTTRTAGFAAVPVRADSTGLCQPQLMDGRPQTAGNDRCPPFAARRLWALFAVACGPRCTRLQKRRPPRSSAARPRPASRTAGSSAAAVRGLQPDAVHWLRPPTNGGRQSNSERASLRPAEAVSPSPPFPPDDNTSIASLRVPGNVRTCARAGTSHGP